MKKTTFLFAIIAFFTMANANATKFPKSVEPTTNDYVINDAEVEVLFANSTELSLDAISESKQTEGLFGVNTTNNMVVKKAGGGKSAIAAIVIDFFVGGLGIHRAYLGTKTFTWIGYILTCGGIGGIVPFVDLIVLCVNAGDISKYEDNPKFFMW